MPRWGFFDPGYAVPFFPKHYGAPGCRQEGVPAKFINVWWCHSERQAIVVQRGGAVTASTWAPRHRGSLVPLTVMIGAVLLLVAVFLRREGTHRHLEWFILLSISEYYLCKCKEEKARKDLPTYLPYQITTSERINAQMEASNVRENKTELTLEGEELAVHTTLHS